MIIYVCYMLALVKHIVPKQESLLLDTVQAVLLPIALNILMVNVLNYLLLYICLVPARSFFLTIQSTCQM